MEKTIVWLIIILCIIYVGKRFVNQFKRARQADSALACGGGCSGCSVSGCEDSSKTIESS